MQEKNYKRSFISHLLIVFIIFLVAVPLFYSVYEMILNSRSIQLDLLSISILLFILEITLIKAYKKHGKVATSKKKIIFYDVFGTAYLVSDNKSNRKYYIQYDEAKGVKSGTVVIFQDNNFQTASIFGLTKQMKSLESKVFRKSERDKKQLKKYLDRNNWKIAGYVLITIFLALFLNSIVYGIGYEDKLKNYKINLQNINIDNADMLKILKGRRGRYNGIEINLNENESIDIRFLPKGFNKREIEHLYSDASQNKSQVSIWLDYNEYKFKILKQDVEIPFINRHYFYGQIDSYRMNVRGRKINSMIGLDSDKVNASLYVVSVSFFFLLLGIILVYKNSPNNAPPSTHRL